MPTIREIINTKEVSVTDDYDLQKVMSYLSDSICDYDPPPDNLTSYLKRVVSVNYDGDRGAITDVVYFNQVPFAVCTRAGRGCCDWVSTFIIDKEYFHKAVQEFIKEEEVSVVSQDTEINLAYWEGQPVNLGDKT